MVTWRRRGCIQKDRHRPYLAWLAGRLKENSVSVFFIEQLQPSWLDGWPSRWSYLVLSRVLGSALITVPLMMFVMFTVEYSREQISVRNWLDATTGAALALGLGVALVDAIIAMIRHARTDSRLGWSAVVSARLVSYVIASGLLTAGFLAMNATPRGDILQGWASFTVTLGALGWTIRNIDRTPNNDVHTLEVVTPSLRGALRGGLYGVAVVGAVVLAVKLLRGKDTSFSDLVFGETAGLIIGATLGMFKTKIRETKNRPNEGILLSGRNAVFVTLALSAVVIATGSSYDYWVGASSSKDELLAAVLIGVTGGFFYAGLDIVKHYALRLILFFHHQAPLRYANFLDYAARLTFVRKVGGGYIFLHPLIVDYFATHPNANVSEPDAPAHPAR